jgi:hypothetical protein
LPSAGRERHQLDVILRGQVQGLLDTIDDRLSTIERRLGITRSVSTALSGLEERIAQVRQAKEAAIDVQDFGQAAVLRDTEKQLIEERARVEQETAAGAQSAGDTGPEGDAPPEVDAGAGVDAQAGAGAEPGAGAGTRESDELGRLRARVAGLEARLREHGIDPDAPAEPPAAAG